MLRITLQNHKVKTTERIGAVTVADFLAMSGGILGLFMGFSALSSIELIYYPSLRLYWNVRRLNAEKEKEKSDQRENSDKPNDSENRANSVSEENAVVQAARYYLNSFICRKMDDCEVFLLNIVTTATSMAFDTSPNESFIGVRGEA